MEQLVSAAVHGGASQQDSDFLMQMILFPENSIIGVFVTTNEPKHVTKVGMLLLQASTWNL